MEEVEQIGFSAELIETIMNDQEALMKYESVTSMEGESKGVKS